MFTDECVSPLGTRKERHRKKVHAIKRNPSLIIRKTKNKELTSNFKSKRVHFYHKVRFVGDIIREFDQKSQIAKSFKTKTKTKTTEMNLKVANSDVPIVFYLGALIE